MLTSSLLLGCDPEYYPNTNTHINRLAIKDSKILLEKENNASLLRAIELYETPSLVSNKFDFETLKNIHFHLFQDIYDWAGIPRNYPVKKGFSIFTPPEDFATAIPVVFSAVEEYKSEYKSKNDIVLLAKVFRLLNKFHPFPEGNGRTQRIFIRLLGHTKGWDLTFEKMPQWEMVEICKQAHEMNLEPMNALFERIMVSID